MSNQNKQPTTNAATNKKQQSKKWKAQDYVTSQIPIEEVIDIKGAFDVFDADGSGVVDPQEFKQAFVNLGLAKTNKLVYNILHTLDGDHPNGLDFAQFLKLATGRLGKFHTRKQIDKVFNSFDHERNGKINIAEFKKVADQLGEHYKQQQIKNIFAKSDFDEDGFVTSQDFYCIMTHQPVWH